MDSQEASNPQEEYAPEEASHDTPPLSPNEALAAKIASALSTLGIISEADRETCQQLLATGTATPQIWRRLVETALFPRTTDDEEDVATDN